jgi:hypothetical protein
MWVVLDEGGREMVSAPTKHRRVSMNSSNSITVNLSGIDNLTKHSINDSKEKRHAKYL